jgi:hypothetical protein
MIDDRVWTVRFRLELADLLREHAAAENLTVQQVIVRSVEAALQPKPADEAAPEAAPKIDQDTYKYG